MTVRTEVKAAPTMLITKVEAPMMVMRGKTVAVKMMMAMDPRELVLVEFLVGTVVKTRVELTGSSMCPSRGSPAKDKQGQRHSYQESSRPRGHLLPLSYGGLSACKAFIPEVSLDQISLSMGQGAWRPQWQ